MNILLEDKSLKLDLDTLRVVKKINGDIDYLVIDPDTGIDYIIIIDEDEGDSGVPNVYQTKTAPNNACAQESDKQITVKVDFCKIKLDESISSDEDNNLDDNLVFNDFSTCTNNVNDAPASDSDISADEREILDTYEKYDSQAHSTINLMSIKGKPKYGGKCKGIIKVPENWKQSIEKPPFNCEGCALTFYTFKEYYYHTKEVNHNDAGKPLSANVDYSCEKCNLKFKTAYEFAMHDIESVHDPDRKKEIVDIYGEKYYFSGSRKHIPIKGPPYTCTTCQFKFNTFHMYAVHHLEVFHKKDYRKKRHFIYDSRAIKSPFQCSPCNLTYDSFEKFCDHVCDLETHSVDTNGPPYKYFGKLLHGPPFLCFPCKISFETFKEYIVHCRKTQYCLLYHCPAWARNRFRGKTYEGPPFNCEECKLEFNDFVNYVDHQKKKHPLIPPKRYQCDRCGKEFKTSMDLYSHSKSHNKQQCPHCGKFIAFLKQHIDAVHVTERNFICDQCPKSFTSNKYLYLHKYQWHSNKKHPCLVCGKEFNSRKSMSNHQRIHSGAQFECSICQKKFNQHQNLIRHKKIHTNQRDHICDICGASFIQKTCLQSHLKVHDPNRSNKSRIPGHLSYPAKCYLCVDVVLLSASHKREHYIEFHKSRMFNCKLCGKSFTQHNGLKSHMLIHMNEKPYACTLCGKRFRQKPHLRSHMIWHSGIKNHKCEFCGKKFSAKGNLDVHRRLHTNETPYECDYCEQKFKSSKDKKKHIMKNHL